MVLCIFVNCYCNFLFGFSVKFGLSKSRKPRPIELSMSRTMILCSKLCMVCIILPVGKMFKIFSLFPGISSHNHCAIEIQAQLKS